MDYGQEMGSDCCACVDEIADFSHGCADRKYVFTKREQDVLDRIREASSRARTIKAEMKGIAPGDAGFEVAERELKSLRQLREELERERLDAAEERMRFLGHAN